MVISIHLFKTKRDPTFFKMNIPLHCNGLTVPWEFRYLNVNCVRIKQTCNDLSENLQIKAKVKKLSTAVFSLPYFWQILESLNLNRASVEWFLCSGQRMNFVYGHVSNM